MQQKVLITGNSSGIGLGLTKEYLQRKWKVYGLSRRGNPESDDGLRDIKCDLNNIDDIEPALSTLLSGVEQLELVFLNAGILGEVSKLRQSDVAHFENVMRINVWANKVILDYLFSRKIKVKQVIALSSGAATSVNQGWAAYSLSKTSLNRLVAFYAEEFSHTHFISLAPGLVDTDMQTYLCDEQSVPEAEFPSVKKMRKAQGTINMPTAPEAARAIIKIASGLVTRPSGSYADIRTL